MRCVAFKVLATSNSASCTLISHNDQPTLPIPSLTRRQLLATTAAGVAITTFTHTSPQAEALPLAPLGKIEHIGGAKLVNLSPEEIANILARNLREGQYFITGDLTPEIFADDCVFADPTNTVKGLARYTKALGILFDANYSAVRLKDIQVTGTNTIEAEWILGGYLKFPWNPRVEPFMGRTVYHLRDGDNLIELQEQTWSISGAEALRETFTPTSGPRRDIVENTV